ncbi:hypothetical protein TNCV_1000321 [Trichonephila clavipes]|nr:hypothetical protein TNCV_1000321 [Trichonephila clavipes]
MPQEQICAVRLKTIRAHFQATILSRPTSQSPSFFNKTLPYNYLGQVTSAHDPSIVTIESLPSETQILEELSPIPTLQTTCENRGRRKIVTRVQKVQLLLIRELPTEVVEKV